jgi:hypothetical protein
MIFRCKICLMEWEVSTFSQVDAIQQNQCSKGHPHQCCVLVAVI